MRFFHDQDTDSAVLLSSSLAVVSISSAFFLVLVAGAAILGIDQLFRLRVFPELLLLSILVVGSLWSRIAIAFARANTDCCLFALQRFGLAAAKLILVLVGVAVFRSVEWYLWGSICATLLALLAGKRSLARYFTSVDWRGARRWVAFGWPFVFHAASAGLLTFADRYMLDYYMGRSAVGIYTLAYSVGSSVMFVVAMLTAYIEPQVYKAGADSVQGERWLTLLGASIGILGAMAGAAVILLAGPIISWKLEKEYFEAAEYIPVIVAAHIVMALYLQASFRLTTQDRTGYIAICSSSAAVANILLNIVLIPRYGIEGAAVATFLSYLVLSIVTLALSVRRPSIKLGRATWGLITLVCIGSSAVALAAGPVVAAVELIVLAAGISLLFRGDIKRVASKKSLST